MRVRSAAGRWRAMTWLGVAVVALSGCWPAPAAGPDHTAHNPFETKISPASVGSFQELWSARLDTAVVGATAVVGNAVYATDLTSVHRLDAATGERRWKASADAPPAGATYRMGPPIVVGDRVLIGWGGRHGTGVDNGRWVTQWLDPGTGAVLDEGPPGGQLVAVRGERVLSTREVLLSSAAEPVPATVIVVADGDGTSWRGVLTSNVTLGRQWIYAAVGGVNAYPVGGEGQPCGPSPELPYLCPLWSVPSGGDSVPVLGDGGATLYVTEDRGPRGAELLALDTATAEVLWSVDLGTEEAGTPALAGDRLYVPASGRLVVVDASGCGAETCEPLWSGYTGWSMRHQPAVAGGVVFATAYDGLSGYVYAFDAAGCGEPTCQALWSDWTYGEVTSPPAVSGGRLFVGTATGDVIAYG